MVHRPLDIRTGIASIGKNPTTKELGLEGGDIQRVAEEYGDGRGEGTFGRFGTPTQDNLQLIGLEDQLIELKD